MGRSVRGQDPPRALYVSLIVSPNRVVVAPLLDVLGDVLFDLVTPLVLVLGRISEAGRFAARFEAEDVPRLRAASEMGTDVACAAGVVGLIRGVKLVWARN